MTMEQNEKPDTEATPAEGTSPAAPHDSPEITPSAGPTQAEYDALMDRLKRVAADYANSQKRLEREMRDRCEYAIEAFARDSLLVADDLSRAIEAVREHHTIENIIEGLELVEKHLYAALKRHGVTPIPTQTGHPFNPEIHEAISMVPTDEYEPNSVVQETQKGFLIHKRLLRPARVIVSTQAQEKPEGNGSDRAPGE